jgi:serine/threonine-protein kinase
VQVTAGQTVTLKPTWPRGSMAINAIPWAEVFVDNARVGETPIGNIAVPIGSHEVIFRHPELGERRLSVTVSVGEPMKVGVDLRSK